MRSFGSKTERTEYKSAYPQTRSTYCESSQGLSGGHVLYAACTSGPCQPVLPASECGHGCIEVEGKSGLGCGTDLDGWVLQGNGFSSCWMFWFPCS